MAIAKGGREGILLDDSGGFHAMEQEIHGGDAEHGLIEVIPMEQAILDVLAVGLQQVAGEMAAAFGIGFDESQGGEFFPEVLHDADEESSSAAGRIANDVRGLGIDQLDHGEADVARGAELSGNASRRELGEEIFVEVPFGVGFREGHFLNGIHGGDHEAAAGDEAVGILEEHAELADLDHAVAEEGEPLVADEREHFRPAKVTEAGPPEFLLIRAEVAAGERLIQPAGAAFLPGLGEVQQTEEHEIGNLLNDGDGIGDPAGMEGEPEGIDFGSVGLAEHGEGKGKWEGKREKWREVKREK